MSAVHLPQRFELAAELGHDQDARVWLARDRQLDRPVRIVVLDDEVAAARRAAFVESVRAVASINHPAVGDVYAVYGPDPSAYAVMEWHSGVSLADRMAAGDIRDTGEVLASGASLASGLAALHRRGITHGALDASAIEIRGAVPRLQGMWRRPHSTDPADDVAALAAIIGAALAGGPAGAAAPSQLRAEVAPAVDHALRAARRGALDAVGLAAALAAATPHHHAPASWNWRWLVPTAVLVTVAVVLIVAGLTIQGRSGSRLLFPITPAAGPAPIPAAVAEIPVAAPRINPPPSSTSVPTAVEETRAGTPLAWDPFGDETEHDADAFAALDGDPTTAWSTELYFDPLSRLKPGVGLAIPVTGPVTTVEIAATAGTRLELAWAPALPQTEADWERIASLSVTGSDVTLQVPPRRDGWWLLWLTDLPRSDTDDGFESAVSEVRFTS